MKPINVRELNQAYLRFVLHFVSLILFVLICIACFFVTSRYEMNLLSQEARQYEKLGYYREEVTHHFDDALVKFKALTQYVNADAQELSNQALLINSIQTDNNKIRGLLDERKADPSLAPAPSQDLYEKMTRNVIILASIKDSLSQTRYQSASLRDQLEACSKASHDVIEQINRIN
ncbi:MAG TPA: hypothetical protein VGC22_11390 [Chitinophaga sp.]